MRLVAPGLPLPDAPPGLEFSFPPGLGLGATKRIVSTEPPPPAIKEREGPFEIKMFRKELVAILRELSVLRNVSRAVRRVRAQNVPAEYQAAEFADVLTRAAEEPRGGTRRLWWAFAAGLGAGVHAPDGSAFSMAECQAGLHIFFKDTYPGLCEEIHRLPVAAKAELVPTLQYVFPNEVMEAVFASRVTLNVYKSKYRYEKYAMASCCSLWSSSIGQAFVARALSGWSGFSVQRDL